MYAIKCAQISGNVNGSLKYRLCPSTEFSTGRWNVAISEVCAHANEEFKGFITLSTDFSVNQQFNNKKEIEIYQQPLITFQLDLTSGAKSMRRFSSPVWLEINRTKDIMNITAKDTFTQTEIKENVEISITLLFKRIA